MEHLFSYILIVFSVFALCMAIQVFTDDWKSKVGKIVVISFLGSSFWSAGIGIMLTQNNDFTAWIFRSIGILGIFVLLNGMVWLFSEWAEMSVLKKRICRLISFGMILVLPHNLHPSNICFEWTNYGMSYKFVPGIMPNLYTAYYIIIAVVCIFILRVMFRTSKKIHKKKLARKATLAIIICCFGMIFDTLMPLLGINSFPASTFSQAFAIFVIYNTYYYYRDNSVNITNLSRFVYDLVQEPMLIYDENDHLCIINNSGMNFLGITEEDKKSYPLNELFDVPKDWYLIGISGAKYEVRCKVNHSFCMLSVDRIEDVYNDTLGYIVLVNDMSEKIKAMHEMEIAKIQAEQANEAKSTFLANMSHEIRTPINAVLGMDEMILRESKHPEIIDYARQIRLASKSLLSIINEILDFSKIESGKMEIVEGTYETSPFFKDIMRLMYFRVKDKKIKIELEMDENFPSKLLGDELRVKQIINNIMTNAIKYTDEGKVVLSVKFTPVVQEKNAEDNMMIMHIAVTDTGKGIDNDQMHKLFESFQRIDETSVHNIEGTGLGLSIVKGLLDMMGGTISVESTLGKGSKFMCDIPQKIVSSKPVGEIFKKKDDNTPKREYKELFTAPEVKVLAVDDNRVNLTVLRGLLKRTKVQVDVATGGAEAIEKATKKSYHIIFMDHMMPEIDGVEAMKQIRKKDECESKKAVIIALTANAIVGMREQYLEMGFDDYLSKPIDSKQLENMMMEYLPEELVMKT